MSNEFSIKNIRKLNIDKNVKFLFHENYEIFSSDLKNFIEDVVRNMKNDGQLNNKDYDGET